MIQSNCPRCGCIHQAPVPITVFACCAHATTRIDRSLLQTVRVTGSEFEPSRKRDKPGDEVYNLIKRHFGVEPPVGCDCRRIQRRMNALGWQKCLAISDELEAELKSNASLYGWTVTIAAAAQAVATGALVWLHPFDPWKSLVAEGCRRARESVERCESICAGSCRGECVRQG